MAARTLLLYLAASVAIHGTVASPVQNLQTGAEASESLKTRRGLLSPVTGLVGAAGSAVVGTLSTVTDTLNNLTASGLNPFNVSLTNPFANTGINSPNNKNVRNPTTTIYPRKSSADPNYSVSEAQLRAAMYIPSGFTYGSGSKQPVILVPGTGVPGGVTYQGNMAKLLATTSFADPLWLNIPTNTLQDIQISSEYVAYAINYINSVSANKKVAVITWSQGSIDTQWAFTYWPSTRSVVTDFIPVSGDLHGTLLAAASCVAAGCVPSITQQMYTSNLITNLRADGGDSAYVPTTSIYSATDLLVQPQIGTGASAYVLDARNVGVTNAEVQTVCAGKLAGGVYTHAGVLSNPLTYALVVDALTHNGPGLISRIDLNTVCAMGSTPGLTPADLLNTEGTFAIEVVNLAIYPDKGLVEPPLKPYAQ